MNFLNTDQSVRFPLLSTPPIQGNIVMAGRNFLFVPGPTNVPDRIQRAMMVPMEDHRSSKFPELTNAVLADLKPLFRTTSGTPLVFPASGTGGQDASTNAGTGNTGKARTASRCGNPA